MFNSEMRSCPIFRPSAASVGTEWRLRLRRSIGSDTSCDSHQTSSLEAIRTWVPTILFSVVLVFHQPVHCQWERLKLHPTLDDQKQILHAMVALRCYWGIAAMTCPFCRFLSNPVDVWYQKPPEEGLHEIHRTAEAYPISSPVHTVWASYTVFGWQGCPISFITILGEIPIFSPSNAIFFLVKLYEDWGTPIAGWFMMDTPTNGWFGSAPPFRETCIFFVAEIAKFFIFLALWASHSAAAVTAVSAGGAAARHCEPWSQEGRALSMDQMDQWYNQPEVGVSIIMGVPPKNEWFISWKIPSRNGWLLRG